jgi:opacity protein-like surface antigen
MKKKLLISLISLCVWGTVQAQDSLHVKPQVSAPYKAAVGLRYSAGGPAGADLGITAKYFFRPQSALELHSTINPEARYYLASLSYIWQPKLATSDRFRPYAGIGVGFLRPDNRFYGEETDRSNIVIIPTLGIEYKFKRIPIAISLDYRSTFLRVSNGASQLNMNHSSNLGLGLKYTFR